MTFLIATLPLEGAFKILTHIYQLWPLGKKKGIQIFNRWPCCKIIKQNVPGGSVLV